MLYNPLSINDLRRRGMPAPRNSLTLSELRGLIPLLPQHLATLGEHLLAQDRAAHHALEMPRNSALKGERLLG